MIAQRWAIVSPQGFIVGSPILPDENETIRAFLACISGDRGWGNWEDRGWRCVQVEVTA